MGRGFRFQAFVGCAVAVGLFATAFGRQGYSPQYSGNGKTPPPTPKQEEPKKEPAKPAVKVQDPVKQVDPDATDPTTVTGITFVSKPGQVFVLARDIAKAIGQPLALDPKTEILMIGEVPFLSFDRTYTGDIILPVKDLVHLNADIVKASGKITLVTAETEVPIVIGRKRVEVNKAEQRLRGYQGDIVVIDTNISTGAPGHNTPNGTFKTRTRERMHYSRLYNNSPMPWSIQFNGDIFFHGYTSVPPYPASHGCVRIPLTKKNPAKYLWHWVDIGVEVKIFGTYSWR
ncbi:MAG TPA: L,D-transpeptidase [Fimbriimonas sp.]|nr:L,D-transpeptidase [Fimbriimonas sp.]